MRHGITIRRADMRDSAGVLQCLAAAFEPYRSVYTREAFEDTVLSPERIAHRLAEMSVFVAVDDGGRVVGTIGGRCLDGGDGHIRGMAVRPEHAGTGVAQELLETVEGELRRQGCSRITLGTTAHLRRAIRFYERNGYRPTGNVRDFFGMPLSEYSKTAG